MKKMKSQISNKLKKENKKLRDKINEIMDDFDMTGDDEGGSRDDFWRLINDLIDNEKRQVK